MVQVRSFLYQRFRHCACVSPSFTGQFLALTKGHRKYRYCTRAKCPSPRSSRTRSLTRTHTHTHSHSLAHSLTHSLTYSLAHLLITHPTQPREPTHHTHSSILPSLAPLWLVFSLARSLSLPRPTTSHPRLRLHHRHRSFQGRCPLACIVQSVGVETVAAHRRHGRHLPSTETRADNFFKIAFLLFVVQTNSNSDEEEVDKASFKEIQCRKRALDWPSQRALLVELLT